MKTIFIVCIVIIVWIAGWLEQFRLWDRWWNDSHKVGCHLPMDEKDVLTGIWLAVLAGVWFLWPFAWLFIHLLCK